MKSKKTPAKKPEKPSGSSEAQTLAMLRIETALLRLKLADLEKLVERLHSEACPNYIAPAPSISPPTNGEQFDILWADFKAVVAERDQQRAEIAQALETVNRVARERDQAFMDNGRIADTCAEEIAKLGKERDELKRQLEEESVSSEAMAKGRALIAEHAEATRMRDALQKAISKACLMLELGRNPLEELRMWCRGNALDTMRRETQIRNSARAKLTPEEWEVVRSK